MNFFVRFRFIRSQNSYAKRTVAPCELISILFGKNDGQTKPALRGVAVYLLANAHTGCLDVFVDVLLHLRRLRCDDGRHLTGTTL